MAQWILDMINDRVRGIFYIAVGTILLLHTLGFFTTYLKMFLIISAILMIAYGALELNAIKRIQEALNKAHQNNNDKKTPH